MPDVPRRPGTVTAPQWLDPDEMAAWRSFVDVSNSVMAACEVELQARHGLSGGDYEVLVWLSESDADRLRMCDLADRLHLSPSGLTRRLDGLVREGLVVREPSTDDRRVMLAVLTPAGRSRLEEAAPDHVDSVRRHFVDHLSRTQLRNLAAALGAIERGERTEA